MRPHIFQAIAQAVAAVPGVAHVGLWNQQVQYLSGGTAWPVPAVFVEFERLQLHDGQFLKFKKIICIQDEQIIHEIDI